jgi:hypothetical protein
MPVIFVRVPRMAFDKYWPLPWSQVVAAAEREVDGCAVAPSHVTEAGIAVIDEVAVPNTAYLRQGPTPSWPADKTILFQQNWTGRP